MSRCVIRYKICTLPGVKQRRLLDKAETDESQEGEGGGYPGHVVDPQPQRPEHQHAQEHQDAAHILARQLQIDTAVSLNFLLKDILELISTRRRMRTEFCI